MRLLQIGVAIVMALCMTAQVFAEFTPHKPFRVASYIPWFVVRKFHAEYGDTWLDALRLHGTTHLYVIGNVEAAPGGTVVWNEDRMTRDELRALRTYTRTKHIKLGQSIPARAWMQGGALAVVAGAAETRACFAANLLKHCREFDLEAIDFDWEFPASGQEEKDYSSLLADVKRAASRVGLTVSVCVSGANRAGKTHLDDDGIRAVDYVHLMAYMPSAMQEGALGASIRHVEYWLNTRGCPCEKLVLGMPFFCKSTQEGGPKTIPYAEYFRRYGRPAASVHQNGYLLNPPEVIAEKTRYAWTNGLAGVMTWATGQDVATDVDDDVSLQHALTATLESLRQEVPEEKH